jgi:hypothetical protein
MARRYKTARRMPPSSRNARSLVKKEKGDIVVSTTLQITPALHFRVTQVYGFSPITV